MWRAGVLPGCVDRWEYQWNESAQKFWILRPATIWLPYATPWSKTPLQSETSVYIYNVGAFVRGVWNSHLVKSMGWGLL